jgi:hypothetical protein
LSATRHKAPDSIKAVIVVIAADVEEVEKADRVVIVVAVMVEEQDVVEITAVEQEETDKYFEALKIGNDVTA